MCKYFVNILTFVAKVGVEPTAVQILSLLCLPFHHKAVCLQYTTRTCIEGFVIPYFIQLN